MGEKLELSDGEWKFCREYIIDNNATAAAIRAGYAQTTAHNAAAWIKKDKPTKPLVLEEIEKLKADISRRTGVTVDRIARELARIGFVNPADIIDTATGKIREDVSVDDIAALASVRVKTGNDYTEYEVKLADKARALELLGKHLGMFTDNVQVSGSVPVVIDDIQAEPNNGG